MVTQSKLEKSKCDGEVGKIIIFEIHIDGIKKVIKNYLMFGGLLVNFRHGEFDPGSE